MVKLHISGKAGVLYAEISNGLASGVYRDTSADTRLDFDRVSMATLTDLCPGLFDYFRKEEGK